ncbi:MAG: tetraacyldisaccharide 4'-kinase [Bacteroidales bacterium]|nr:tetraacyldisaccharide 4'-kinase [Bacteroidales bacterium]MCF8458441.1 tetraacyldisaccharide 4'-kinase [Bacteroidales bacterium]
MLGANKIVRFLILYPASILFGLITYVRNRLFDYQIILKEKQFAIPVLSVGNITVGGTGKTPHIEYLVSLLKDDFRIATLSRGYKRNSKGFLLATKQSTVYEIGDEPKQIKQKFPDIEVAVDEKRVRGIEKLQDDFKDNLDIVLLDDAFQHRYVKPGLSILLIDFTQPMFTDHMLPYGRLRENRHEKRRANIIIVTKVPPDIKPIEKRILFKNLDVYPFQNLYFTSQKQGALVHLFKNPQFNKFTKIKLTDNYVVMLLTGIANPEHLRQHVETFSPIIHFLTYPDHYTYKQKDILKIVSTYDSIENEKKIIVTTEKDAMRLRDVANANELMNLPVFFVPLEIRFHGKDKQDFDNQIIGYVRKNKRNSNLHTRKNRHTT